MVTQTSIASAVRRTVKAAATMEGAGFEVRRALPAAGLGSVGPFIFFDHFGPAEFQPGDAKGAPSHPHAGIETLSYLLEGQAQHKDSLGNVSILEVGDVQWMRSGRGIVHDERPSRRIQTLGGRMHGLQLWINMPAAQKLGAPAYRHFLASEVAEVVLPGAVARIIAGELFGRTGPLLTFGRPVLAHLKLSAQASLKIPARLADELGLYLLSGGADVAGRTLNEGELALISPSESFDLRTGSLGAEAILLGGEPLDVPIVRHGPFVMNTTAQIQDAVRDFQSGKMGWVEPGI